MPVLTCQISQALWNLFAERSRTEGQRYRIFASTTLSRCFCLPRHTLLQISTSGALVEGIYKRAVSSSVLLSYGSFGIGTLENLDPEMVILETKFTRSEATAVSEKWSRTWAHPSLSSFPLLQTGMRRSPR